MRRKDIVLKDWRFALGKEQDCLLHARTVGEIHTWNVEEGSEDIWDTGWYEHTIAAAKEWEGRRIWVKFGAVYHDAVVYCNGVEIGRHENSGFTPFTVELTKAIRLGEDNHLVVKASNRFSGEMLPYQRSFDWANDGGMIRPAHLYVTGQAFLEEAEVTASPRIKLDGHKQMHGEADLAVNVKIGGNLGADSSIEWKVESNTTKECLFAGERKAAGEWWSIPEQWSDNVTYWHFDQPQLYTLSLILKSKDQILDRVEISVGFREFRTQDGCFYLNGEQVRLSGTEWMPGSDPEYGIAEPVEQLEKMLVCLKESNCIYTRFHWQQDEAVFDWCDRHGMLVQEEVPYWGADPAEAGWTQWKVFKEQFQEMWKEHRNHPSIIAWGVGNELDGHSGKTKGYIQQAVDLVHQSDRDRMANYVSNSCYYEPEIDGTLLGDVKMINEYTGTWMMDCKAKDVVRNVIKAAPELPLVISEYGLCEPVFAGGDEGRSSLFLEKMRIYRNYKRVAGTINFCLNDYRTQMGEEGEGRFRRRVHGSTELDGTPKPSYYVVQRECAPFTVNWKEDNCAIRGRFDLPSYTMNGYRLKFLNEQGREIEEQTILELCPGDEAVFKVPGAVEVAVFRTNGDAAGVYRRAE